jgi:pyridoxal 5'-phosphate synthase pdxT subunit
LCARPVYLASKGRDALHHRLEVAQAFATRQGAGHRQVSTVLDQQAKALQRLLEARKAHCLGPEPASVSDAAQIERRADDVDHGRILLEPVNFDSVKVGVLAVQGDFEKHIEALHATGKENLNIQEVRTAEELAGVERLIIPGGESTTVGLLLERYGLGAAMREAAAEGMPIWGTCMGMILMAKDIAGKPGQYTLGLLDIEVTRNAFGAQVHSFEDSVPMKNLDEPVLGVFIRAPVVSRIGEGIEELGKYEDKLVAVQRGKLLGTSFHPELTEDRRLHTWFLEI